MSKWFISCYYTFQFKVSFRPYHRNISIFSVIILKNVRQYCVSVTKTTINRFKLLLASLLLVLYFKFRCECIRFFLIKVACIRKKLCRAPHKVDPS